MKRLLIIAIAALLATTHIAAQPKGKQHILMVSMYETLTKTKMIVTREDGTQEEKQLNLIYPAREKNRAAYEDSLLFILKPLFEDGWKLNATSKGGFDGASSGQVTRYFFTKQDE